MDAKAFPLDQDRTIDFKTTREVETDAEQTIPTITRPKWKNTRPQPVERPGLTGSYHGSKTCSL